MTKRLAQRQTPVATLLRDMQSHSLLARERRTTVLKLTVVGETLSDLDLNCANFIESEIADSTFYNCDLRGASFKDSTVERVKFINCSICDMELPEDFRSITFHNCSTTPAGMSYSSRVNGDRPTTLHGKILDVVEAITRAATTLSTERILSVAVILAFIAIIVVAVSLPK